MAKEVFDQARPKSVKAQLFAEAFRGCDEWVVPPRKPRSASQSLFDAHAPVRFQDTDLDFREAA
ncbi:MAG: hypothetical protein ACSLFI_11745 [Solirubrobacterales bacterium]